MSQVAGVELWPAVYWNIHFVNLNSVLVNSNNSITKAGFTNVLTVWTLLQTESVPIATYNQLLDANQCTMTAVRDKSRAAADQMNAAAKNAEQAVRWVLSNNFLLS